MEDETDDRNKIIQADMSMKFTGRSEMVWLIALQAAAVAPVCIAFIDTSIRKKNTAGIGSRTWNKSMEKFEKTYSLQKRTLRNYFNKQDKEEESQQNKS